jgi:hypothetical protein
MPKITSGLTQKERLKVLQSIDSIILAKDTHEQKVLLRYRTLIARECVYGSKYVPGWAVNIRPFSC